MAQPEVPRFLVAPLDWGMGHATRCIPFIEMLQQQGAQVVVAAPDPLVKRLKLSLKGVEFISLRGYEIEYHQGIPVWMSILLQLPKIRRATQQEHQWLMKHAGPLQLSRIYSDNRYGLWHPQLPSFLITHQLQPLAPFGGSIARALIRKIMHKLMRPFTEILVPDHPGSDRLSGSLSEAFEGLPPVKYIGPLSRFHQPVNVPVHPNATLAILSGPEPHYSQFYHAMKARATAQNHSFKALGWKLPRGANPNDVFLNLSDTDFATEVAKAEKVVCSAGYSTLCDLRALGKQAEVFPTPGQTEQGYLARRWMEV